MHAKRVSLSYFLAILLIVLLCQTWPHSTAETGRRATGEVESQHNIGANEQRQQNGNGLPIISADEPMSAEMLQAFLNIGLYFDNGTVDQQQTAQPGGTKKKPKGKLPELSCNAQEKSLCANARMCIHRDNASDFECLCRRGYAGRFCQFSLFPRSCADALSFHEDAEESSVPETGVWQLDIDGSGPLPATHAECITNGGTTVVRHNAPSEGFAVRDAELSSRHNQTGIFFPIAYKLFSAAQLRALIERSEICSQSIRFDCEQSPLDFKGNLTWLEVASREGQQHRQIGTKPFSCACRNKELYGCGRDELSCYCDDLSQPTATDQAVLYNTSAGVTAVFFRHPEKGQQKGGSQRLTLGPLECSGEAGTSPNAFVTLRTPTARLETGVFPSWRQLELDFRTWQPDIEHMVTGWAPEGGEMQLKISLREGHRIELTLSHQKAGNQQEQSVQALDGDSEDGDNEADEAEEQQQRRSQPKLRRRQEQAIRRELSVSIVSPRALNDLFWHRLVVEIFRAEVRFSIDRLNAFQPLTFPFPMATRFAVGGDEQGHGFVGCIGNFRVDQRLVDWRSQLELLGGDTRVDGGCADLCADNQCQQGARCVEHFDTQTTTCECRQPRIHFGEHCEKNVNENSSVAFSGAGFLRFRDLHVSALHADVVFSARTDQRRALFLYEHDEADNFVQIHLAEEHRVVLTVNNLSKTLSCGVEAPPGKVFNTMEWHQFVLERDVDGPGSVALQVDELRCQIGGHTNGGPILLNSENGKEKEVPTMSTELEDVILPPVPLAKSATPFHILFIGGLPRVKRSRRSRSSSKRLPLYVSDVPLLKGCVRGLLIDGEKLDLREAVENGTFVFGDEQEVRVGCEDMQCEELHCKNDGKCKVDWNSVDNAASCDCTMTSFGGTNCSAEIGLAFNGHSSVLFDLAYPKRFSFLGDSERQVLSFAFNAGNNKDFAQQIATVYFENGTELHILLEANGTLLMGLLQPSPEGPSLALFLLRFNGNFTDGFRHFLHAQFRASKSPLITLDGKRQTLPLPTGQSLGLAEARIFYFGGKQGMDDEDEKSPSNSEESKGSQSREVEENAVPTETPADAPKNVPSVESATPAEPNQRAEQPQESQAAANSESIIMADAMREILARQVDNDNNNEIANAEAQNETAMAEANNAEALPKKQQETTEKWQIRQVQRFQGRISNVLVEFERELNARTGPDVSVLRFTPLVYYLQEEEILHRSVRTDPLDIPAGGKLPPATSGQFRVPEAIPPQTRDVQFPVWEAPFHAVPFLDWDPMANAKKDQRLEGQDSPIKENMAVWVVSILLILLLLLILCCWLCRNRVGKSSRSKSAEFYDTQLNVHSEKKPMLETKEMPRNGPTKPERKEQPPVQLLLQRPLTSPTPPSSPVVVPKIELFPEPAQVKQQQPKSILRTPGLKKAPAPGPIKMHDILETPTTPTTAGSKAMSDSATSSSGTYFTARDFFPNDRLSTQSNASSFLSLEQPEPPVGTSGEDEDEDSLIGQHFNEDASQVLDDGSLEELNNGNGLLHSLNTSSRSSSASTQLPNENGTRTPSIGASRASTLTPGNATGGDGE